MKKQRFIPEAIAGIVVLMLVTACEVRVGKPESTNPWSEEPLVRSLPAIDPEATLHLFEYDVSAPLFVQEHQTWTNQDATWVDLSYSSRKGGTVPATLVIPEGRGPFAGIMMMHGGAYASKRQDEYWRASRYAKLGAVTLLIDAPFARPEAQAEKRPYGPLTWREGDREEQIQLIVDLQRGVDLLISRPDVDTDRMAYIGNSFGGAIGGLLVAVETRLKAYVLEVGDGGWVTHYTGPEDMHAYPAGPYFRVSEPAQQRWLEAMWPIEPIHYVGSAAHAALLFQNGTRDVAVPPRDALSYQAAGSEPKTILWYDSPHALPAQALQDQVLWLQKYIGTGTVFGSVVLVPCFRESGRLFSHMILLWLLILVGSVANLGWYLKKEHRFRSNFVKARSLLCWFLPVIVLGPLGLLAFKLSRQNRDAMSLTFQSEAHVWRKAVVSVTWTVTATIAGVLTAAVLILSRLESQQNSPVQLAINFSLPFLANLGLWLILCRTGSCKCAAFGALISTMSALIGTNFVMIVLQPFWMPVRLTMWVQGFCVALQLAAVVGFVSACPFHLWLVTRVLTSGPEQEHGRVSTYWVGGIGVFVLSVVTMIGAIAVALAFINDLSLGALLRIMISGN